ncbi:MAG: hypothetical protein MUP17_02730 [candidate division Zixibacteria bacterium]|nr:hypothetical protein [candidate division Zixibacteria bacterium]
MQEKKFLTYTTVADLLQLGLVIYSANVAKNVLFKLTLVRSCLDATKVAWNRSPVVQTDFSQISVANPPP